MDISNISESLKRDIQFPDYSLLPELITANIDYQIPQLKGEWTVATQTTTSVGEIYSRTYSVLSYPAPNHPDAVGRVIQINGVNPEPYDGFPFYYSVSTQFYETSYSSSIDLGGNKREDFLRWNRDRMLYRHEMIYSHKSVGNTVWRRPFNITPPANPEEPASTIYPPIFLANRTLPLIYANSAISAQVTGTNATFPQGDLTAAPNFQIDSNSPLKVELVSSEDDPEPLEVTDPYSTHFLLRKPFIRITLLSSLTAPLNLPAPVELATHRAIRVTFYGTYKWSSYMPLRTLTSDVIRHRANTPLNQRRVPPGVPNLPQNFWNSQLGPQNQIERFDQRFVSSPGLPLGDLWQTVNPT